MPVVLLIGSGAREHALARALVQSSPDVTLHAAPGNPGIAMLATQTHPLVVTDALATAELAERIDADLVVIGPEVPLMHAVADAVRARGIPCFGPDVAAARIEGSKAFAKEIMAAAGVPTAAAHVCRTARDVQRALDSVARPGIPYVVKEDGLAAGKGVVVTRDRVEAEAHASAVLATSTPVVIEEYLDGPEVSLFFLCDGVHVRALIPAADFKRAYDNDQGPNTGGMGAYAPLRWLPDDFVDVVTDTVAQPLIDELRRRGTPFIGLLYAGLALTSAGIRVVEFNARFGDPETQAVLALLESSVYDALFATATAELDKLPPLIWRTGRAVVVVLASDGYPHAPRTGDTITGDLADTADSWVLQAGTSRDDTGKLVTAGGRVLSVVSRADTLTDARDLAYARVAGLHFDGCHFRSDIALSASTVSGR